MDERQLRLRLGFVVVAAALTTAILINQFGDLPVLGQSRYTIYALFPEAPGISVDTPVRKSGVTIGRVTKWELMQPLGVRVTMSLESKYQVLDTEICRITTASVLGDAVIEFVPGKRGQGRALVEGSVVEDGMVIGNPLMMITNLETEFKTAMSSIERAARDIQVVAQNLNTAFGNNQDQLPRLMQKSELAMDQFSNAMTSIKEVFGDPKTKAQLTKSVQELPLLMQEAREAVGKANQTFESFARVSARAETNLENLENFTRPFGERGEKIVANLEGSLANANELLEQLVEFSDALNSNEGTLGRLMHDPELYNRLTRVMTNVEDLTRKAKPIMSDIGIFADKIARDPRQLGVKGALDGRPSGTGYKHSVTEGSIKQAVYNEGMYFYDSE